MKPGALVVPRCTNSEEARSIFLTPQIIDAIEDMENWIEWKPNQLGIVLGEANDRMSSLIVVTPNGIGTCFPDELLEI